MSRYFSLKDLSSHFLFEILKKYVLNEIYLKKYLYTPDKLCWVDKQQVIMAYNHNIMCMFKNIIVKMIENSNIDKFKKKTCCL